MVAPNTNTSTFENISVRKGYSKGQNAMGMKWSPKTMVTLEKSQDPYGKTTVKFIADDGKFFKMEMLPDVFKKLYELLKIIFEKKNVTEL